MWTAHPGLRNSHEFRYNSNAKESRRPLDCGEHRRSLPARSAVRAEACRVRQSSGVLTGDAESLGGRSRVGIGGVLCAPESGDSRRSPRAADKPPLRGPVEPRRRLLDCGEHRRSLPARSAISVAAFARMQTGPPGLRNSHEFRYSSNAKESRKPLDCGEHRRSLPARSAVPKPRRFHPPRKARRSRALQGLRHLNPPLPTLSPASR